MKRLIFSITYFLSVSGFAQNTDSLILEKIQQKLNITGEDCFTELVTQQNFGQETLVIIPTFNEKEDGYAILDSHIILFDNKTGEILAKFEKQKDWYTDAVRLENIEIIPEKFKLGENLEAFQLKIYYSVRSRYNAFQNVTTSLLLRDKDSVHKILDEFDLKIITGDANDDCAAEIEQHLKNLKVAINSQTKFPDIHVTDSIKNYKTDTNCEDTIILEQVKTTVLEYRKDKYLEIDTAKK